MNDEAEAKLDRRVLIRVKNEAQRERWKAAAKLEGESLNAWALKYLDQASGNPEFVVAGPRILINTKGEHQGYRLKLLTDLVRSLEKKYDCEVIVQKGDESSLVVYDVPVTPNEQLNYHTRLTDIETAEEKAS